MRAWLAPIGQYDVPRMAGIAAKPGLSITALGADVAVERAVANLYIRTSKDEQIASWWNVCTLPCPPSSTVSYAHPCRLIVSLCSRLAHLLEPPEEG